MNISARIRTATALVALVAPVALAAAAHAAAAGDAPRAVVRYSPAGAATEQGAGELYRRIALAAAQVCPEDSPHQPARNALVRQCRQDAIDRAVAAIPVRHLVEIAALHARRG